MKKNKFILLSLVSIFLLTSCWEEVVIKEDKKDFYIDTQVITDFSNDHTIEKVWKVWSKENISVSTQVSGRINAIYAQEGRYVNKWDVIVKISDNIANYGLSLESAKNALEKAKVNYESTEVSLNKAIEDIKRDLKNSELNNLSSSSSLELEKIENSIKKLNLDYQNSIISNQEQINGFKNSFKRDYTNFSIYVEDIIDFSDEILWVTSDNRDKNDDFEDYLGLKNTQQLNETKDILRELISYKQIQLNGLSYNFEWTSWFSSNVAVIELWYNIIDRLLVQLDEVFDNSIPSVWNLSETEISTFKSQVSTFTSLYNTNNSSFVWLQNSLSSFLETYQNSEKSFLKQIELLEQDKRIFIQSLDYKIDVTNATLQEAIKNKELQLRNLEIIITDAEIWYKQALKQYSKLTITAPISGTISDILVDVWQEINTGVKLFNIANNSKAEVEISLTDNELKYVRNWANVDVLIWTEKLTWFITAISKTARENLWYTATISLDKEVDLVGNIVKVKIPVSVDNLLLPVRLIETIWGGQAQIKTFSGGVLENNIVQLGQIWGNNIEILPGYDENMMLITSEIKNYDPNKYNLKVNQPESE